MCRFSREFGPLIILFDYIIMLLCRELMDPGTFGDRLSVYLLSVALGVRIGVLRPAVEMGRVIHTNIRHVAGRYDVDLLLVHNGAHHYSAAGRFFVVVLIVNVVFRWKVMFVSSL